MTKPDAASSDKSLRLLPVLGTRGRTWLIVNQQGGCVDRFNGTKREAREQAKKLLKDAK